MSAYKPVYHMAPTGGVETVYANVKYPRRDPPERIEIAGVTFVREDVIINKQGPTGDMEESR